MLDPPAYLVQDDVSPLCLRPCDALQVVPAVDIGHQQLCIGCDAHIFLVTVEVRGQNTVDRRTVTICIILALYQVHSSRVRRVESIARGQDLACRQGQQAFADIQPLRYTFTALFFVSLGMLANLDFIRDNLSAVALVVVAILVGKFIICSLITRIFGYSHKTVLMVGTGLIQIGEISFILAMMGVETGILSERLYSMTVAAAIITMLLTPFAINLNSLIYRWLSQKRFFANRLAGRFDPDWRDHAGELSRHAVICGYGGIGSRVAAVLEKQKFPYLVIELDPQIISRLRAQGIPCIYGDASNPEILAHAYLEKARVLVCTIPDYVAVDLTARNALKINPRLDIVARVRRDADAELMKGIGVNEVVQPLFEGSLEVIRHTLHRFGMTSTEIQYILTGLREGQIEKPKE